MFETLAVGNPFPELLFPTALFIFLIVSDVSPLIVNILEFEVWVELLTVAVNDVFVCDGNGGGMSVALRCARNLSVEAMF